MDDRRRVLLSILVALLWFGRIVYGNQFWCYECNVDLREGHKGDCNDPYGSGANLTACPDNELHQCLKSVVFYKNILATVRGCVPSRMVKTYCQLQEIEPDAQIECFFCKDYACNGSSPGRDLEGGGNDRVVISIAIAWIAWNRKFYQ